MVRTAASSRSVFSSQPRFSKEGDFKIDFESSEDALTLRSSASHLPMTAQACCVTVLTTFRLSAQPGAEARLTVVQARGVPPKLPPLPSTRGGRREQLPTPRRDDELPRGSQAEAWGSREAVPHGGDTLTPPGHGCPWGHAAALPLRARSLPGCPAR